MGLKSPARYNTRLTTPTRIQIRGIASIGHGLSLSRCVSVARLFDLGGTPRRVVCVATGETRPMDILGNAFFDDDSDDDGSSSMAVKGRRVAVQGSSSSGSRQTRTYPTKKLPMKPKGSLGDGPSKVQYTDWRELAEIFSVRFLEFEKLSLEDLYGVILAAGFYSYVIFERYFGDPLPCIDSEGYIRLTGPRRAVVASSGLTLRSCLFNSRIMEHPCCQRGVMWTSMHTSFDDQFMCKEIESDFGPIEVQYAVYENSAEAILEVTPIDWEGKGECAEVEIFGTVTARNNKVTDFGARSLLFYKKSEEAIRIACSDAIPLPLSRNVTVLPLGSTLMVDLSISVDGILVEETVPLYSSLTGEEEKIVCGNRGKIIVKATWKADIDWQEIEGIL